MQTLHCIKTPLNKCVLVVVPLGTLCLEVGHLSRAEDVVDVLWERQVYYLGVVEQNHCGLVVHTRQPIQLLHV